MSISYSMSFHYKLKAGLKSHKYGLSVTVDLDGYLNLVIPLKDWSE